MLKITRRLHAGWPYSRFCHCSIALCNLTASEKLFNIMSNDINKEGGNNCADIFARLPVPSANINKAAAPDKSLWFTQQLSAVSGELQICLSVFHRPNIFDGVWWATNLNLALNLTNETGRGPEKAFMKVAERRGKKKIKFHRRQTHGVTTTHTQTCTEM